MKKSSGDILNYESILLLYILQRKQIEKRDRERRKKTHTEREEK